MAGRLVLEAPEDTTKVAIIIRGRGKEALQTRVGVATRVTKGGARSPATTAALEATGIKGPAILATTMDKVMEVGR